MLSPPAVMIQISKLQYKRFNHENADSEPRCQEDDVINRCCRDDTIEIHAENCKNRVDTIQQTDNGEIILSSRTDSSVLGENHHNENLKCTTSPPSSLVSREAGAVESRPAGRIVEENTPGSHMSQPVFVHARACGSLTKTQQLEGSAEDAADASSALAAAGKGCACESTPGLAGEEGADAVEDAGGQVCFVCMDAPVDAILIECGHGGLCAGEAMPQQNQSHVQRL